MFVDGVISTDVLSNGDILNLSGEIIYIGELLLLCEELQLKFISCLFRRSTRYVGSTK